MNDYNQEYINEIKELVKKYPKNFIRSIKSKGFKNRFPDRTYLYQYILNQTSNMAMDFHTLKTRVYWVLNNIQSWNDERLKCQVCGKPYYNRNIRNINIGYDQKTCCLKCSRILAQKMTEQNMLKKYGVKNAFQLKDVKEKIKKEKDIIDKKKKQTRFYHFGDPNFNNPKKALQTKIQRYGTAWISSKCKKTMLEKYGCENPMQNNDIRERQQKATYFYDNQKFDSSWEVYFYIWLKDNKIKFIFHPDEPKLWYKKKDDNTWHRYYPDFFLEETKQLIEIKGDNAFDENRNPIKNGWDDWSDKYECMKQNNVKILLQEDIQRFIEYVESKYGNKYIFKFKIYN